MAVGNNGSFVYLILKTSKSWNMYITIRFIAVLKAAQLLSSTDVEEWRRITSSTSPVPRALKFVLSHLKCWHLTAWAKNWLVHAVMWLADWPELINIFQLCVLAWNALKKQERDERKKINWIFHNRSFEGRPHSWTCTFGNPQYPGYQMSLFMLCQKGPQWAVRSRLFDRILRYFFHCSGCLTKIKSFYLYLLPEAFWSNIFSPVVDTKWDYIKCLLLWRYGFLHRTKQCRCIVCSISDFVIRGITPQCWSVVSCFALVPFTQRLIWNCCHDVNKS